MFRPLLIASLIVLGAACGSGQGGTTENNSAAKRCDPNPCQNDGTCSEDERGFRCSCRSGFSGGTCQIDSDDCTPNPCQNNGTCKDAVNSFSCLCAAGFTGTTCGTNIDECKAEPCANGGTCSDDINSVRCSCAAGYRGTTCEMDVDDCSYQPCQNGAICHDRLNGFSCDCKGGDRGNLCDNTIRDCNSEPCQNGGSCSDEAAGFRCSCAPGFSGAYCEVDVDDCNPNPCLNGALCRDRPNGFSCECAPGFSGATCATDTDECGGNPCKNAAVCTDQIDGFSCRCAAGYRGPTCEIDVKDCSPDPCKNGGTCMDAVNGFNCVCLLGYRGTICDNNLSDCSGKPCQNGGKCSDTDHGFVCSCAAGYNGYTCQHNIDDCSPNPCQNGGKCSDRVNGFSCECADGFSGVTCATNKNDCPPDACKNASHCVDEVNAFHCECALGYLGEACLECAPGFQDRDGDGSCLADCSDGGAQSCSGHGSCDDSSGTAICSCDTGFDGEHCEVCARGYQNKAGDDTCSASCDQTSLGDCSGHGSCADLSGSAICNCAFGYAGSVCHECAKGFQDHDGNASCQLGCDGLDRCSGHGSCDDASGNAAACSCDSAYAGSSCAECAPGYQDRDGDGSCLPGCGASGPNCGAHGTCADSSGTAGCACDSGYAGASCSSCAGGYQDNDDSGSCLPNCASANLSCGAGAECSDAAGTASCVCSPGYTGNGISCTVSIVARWRMDEGAGNILADTSGNDNGATATLSAWDVGQYNSGFAGRAITDNPLPSLSGITITMWLKRGAAGDGTPRIVSLEGDQLELGDLDHGGTLAVNIAGLGWRDTGQAFGTGFNHVAVTALTGTTKVYWNGSLLQSYEGGSVDLSSRRLGIKQRCTLDEQNFNGVIDELRVYGGAFNPSTIQAMAEAIPSAGLAAHYDAQELGSVIKDGSGIVSEWRDLSGNARTLTVWGSAPTYDPALIHSHPGLNFGGARRLRTGPFPISAEVTLYAVVQQHTPDLRGAIAHHGNRDTDWSLEQAGSNVSGETHFQSNSDDNAVELTLNGGVNYILTGRIAGTTRYFSAASNSGTVLTSGDGVSITAGSKALYVGTSDAGEGSNAYVGEIIYYNRSLDSAEQEQVMGFLRARWGI